ncbi:hypothetical protein [Streptomyces flaveolus]|uniref:hypothetical protein n=1 Tax=Streptomyces flaveolus TaxID=67297 RepID=UPI00367C6C12
MDSTAVRAQQHAVGAKKTLRPQLLKRGPAQGRARPIRVLRKLAVRLAEVVRSANGLERSRRGFTTGNVRHLVTTRLATQQT